MEGECDFVDKNVVHETEGVDEDGSALREVVVKDGAYELEKIVLQHKIVV